MIRRTRPLDIFTPVRVADSETFSDEVTIFGLRRKSLPYLCTIGICIPLAFSLSLNLLWCPANSLDRELHTAKRNNCFFPSEWYQCWEWIQNGPKGSTVPANRFQTSIQELPDLRLCLLCCSQSSKNEKNGSSRVYSRYCWVPFPSSFSMKWDKRISILFHLSSSHARSSAFLLFDRGFRPENFKVSLGITVRIKYMKSRLRVFFALKNWIARFIGMDLQSQQPHRTVLSLADSIAVRTELWPIILGKENAALKQSHSPQFPGSHKNTWIYLRFDGGHGDRVAVAVSILEMRRISKSFFLQKRFPGKGMAYIAECIPYNPIGKFSFPEDSNWMNDPLCLIDFHGFQSPGHCLMRFRIGPSHAE